MKKVRDHYFHRAKREGYAARSAYKLEEVDQKHRLLHKGMRVLDLGCYPGSWLQYVAKHIGSEGRALGVDLQPVDIGFPKHIRTLQGDVFALTPETTSTSLLVVAPQQDAPDSTPPARSDAKTLRLLQRVVLAELP